MQKFSSVCIFIHTVLYSILCCVNSPFRKQKVFSKPTFLSPKTYALLVRILGTKSDIYITIFTVKHYVNNEADENF